MIKISWTKFFVGLLVYSILYFILGYVFKLSTMCYTNLSSWDCLGPTLLQTLFFGLFAMLLDFVFFKKFFQKAENKNK